MPDGSLMRDELEGEDAEVTLGRMCEAAARYSDRYDEYIRTGGTNEFEGEARNWFHIFRDAVNEAYFEISRSRLTPEIRVEYELEKDRVIQLAWLNPEACSVCGVYRADGQTEAEYVFRTRTEIEVIGAQPGEKVVLHYHYLPDRLEKESDEPVFPESMADPMIYISLAVARMWQSERKPAAAQPWLAEYYQKLRVIRPDMKPARRKRLPRTLFR